MIKVGIVTINDNDNYGNRLQNYALQVFLKSYADIVKTIWYDSPTDFKLKDIMNLKSAIKFIINRNGYKNYLKKVYVKECIKTYNIRKFSQKYIVTDFVNELDLKEPNTNYRSNIGTTGLVCPVCGGKLLKIHGRYGDFLGCENYRKTGCTYKRNIRVKG